MSTHIKYGQIETILEKDAEGYAFSCPLCHSLFFSNGELSCCQKVLQDHLQQYHKVCPTRAVISECDKEPTRILLKKAQ